MKKTLTVPAIVFAVVIGAGAIVLASFNVDQYRPQIQAAISKQLGCPVTLGGSLHMGASLKGMSLSVQDVSFGNPSWASRDTMATIKSFELKVALLPLLQHRIDIKGLAIEDADILLESQDENHHNWARDTETVPEPTGGKTATPIAINVTSLSIKNSRIGMMGADHKITWFTADKLSLGRKKTGLGLNFTGSLNDQPIKLKVLTNADALLSQEIRPVDIDLTFEAYHLTASGKMDVASQKAVFDRYDLVAGDSKISGHMNLAWDAARPELTGVVSSEHLAVADFKNKNVPAEARGSTPSSKNPQRVFSDTPLNLEAFNAANVNFDISMADVVTGSLDLHDVKTKLAINNGQLFLSPLSLKIGSGTVTGQMNVNANAPLARMGATFTLKDVDISDVITAWGAEAFLSGKVKADINLASTGDSMHELASNLSGVVYVIGAGGDVISTAVGKVSAGIAEILSPGSSNHQGMNCLVSRLIAQNGKIKSNGILVDTGAATMAGYGDIDLHSETLNLDFYTRPKLVDVSGFLPSLHVGGTLAKPTVAAHAQSIMQNVGNLLLNGETPEDPVPDLLIQQGQNACAYTLDHPATAAASSKGGVVQDMAGKARGLLKGLLGQ